MGKTFTVLEANRALIFVKPVMEDIQKTLLELVKLHQNPNEGFYKEVELKLKKIAYHFEELKQVGCFCRDPEKGLVDFPSFYHTEPVFLSWSLDEESINAWHKVNEDPHQRREIDEAFLQGSTKVPQATA
jgi:hypothetical protein